MRKLVAGFAASVDGYIEGPNGEIDWILIDEKIDFAAYMKRFDAFFYGRKSYEAALAMNQPASPGVTNYVFSNTLKTVDKNFNLVTGEVRSTVAALKNEKGKKDIAVFGGANLLASLLDHQLVDEIVISFIPVLLGSGKPMVDVLNRKVWLSFVSSRRYGNGTLMVNYAVKYRQ